jgi:hypothetical protein
VLFRSEELRKEAEAKEKALQEERRKAQAEKAKLEAEIKAKRDAEEKSERERKQAEDKAKQASDTDKLKALASTIQSLQMPDVKSEKAKKTVENASELLAKVVSYIHANT